AGTTGSTGVLATSARGGPARRTTGNTRHSPAMTASRPRSALVISAAIATVAHACVATIPHVLTSDVAAAGWLSHVNVKWVSSCEPANVIRMPTSPPLRVPCARPTSAVEIQPVSPAITRASDNGGSAPFATACAVMDSTAEVAASRQPRAIRMSGCTRERLLTPSGYPGVRPRLAMRSEGVPLRARVRGCALGRSGRGPLDRCSVGSRAAKLGGGARRALGRLLAAGPWRCSVGAQKNQLGRRCMARARPVGGAGPCAFPPSTCPSDPEVAQQPRLQAVQLVGDRAMGLLAARRRHALGGPHRRAQLAHGVLGLVGELHLLLVAAGPQLPQSFADACDARVQRGAVPAVFGERVHTDAQLARPVALVGLSARTGGPHQVRHHDGQHRRRHRLAERDRVAHFARGDLRLLRLRHDRHSWCLGALFYRLARGLRRLLRGRLGGLAFLLGGALEPLGLLLRGLPGRLGVPGALDRGNHFGQHARIVEVRLARRHVINLTRTGPVGTTDTVSGAAYGERVVMSLANVVLDAGVVTRCRRRVHWEHDPAAPQLDPLPENPAVEQRKADAQAHRAAIAKLLAEEFQGSGWVEVPTDAEPEERIAATVAALQQGVSVISGGLLPVDVEAGRRGGAELLVRTPGGYVPVIVVRHRITDSGEGALTTALTDLNPDNAREDPERKVRSHPRDQFRLAHVVELLRAAGYADPDRVVGGVIGLDADVVLWHDLLAPSFPGEKSTMQE